MLLDGGDIKVQKIVVPCNSCPCHSWALLDVPKKLWPHTVTEVAGYIRSLTTTCTADLGSQSFTALIKLPPRMRPVPSQSHEEEVSEGCRQLSISAAPRTAGSGDTRDSRDMSLLRRGIRFPNRHPSLPHGNTQHGYRTACRELFGQTTSKCSRG